MAWSASGFWTRLSENFRRFWAHKTILMGSEHGRWRPLANRAMWSLVVIMATPKFDLCPGIVKVQEPMLVEAFESDPGVKTFNEGVVGRFTRSAEVQDDAIGVGPVELALRLDGQRKTGNGSSKTERQRH
jgi:hypothetical protein